MKDRFFTDEELLEPKSRRDILKENLQRVLKADAENVTELDDITYSSEEELTDILSTSCIHVAMKDGEGKIYDVYHFGPVYASTDRTEKGDKLVNDATLQGYTIILKSGARSKTNINNNLRIVSGGVDVKGKSSSGNYALRSFQPSDSWDGLMPTHSAGALKKTETTDVLLPYPSAKTDAKKNELYNAFFKTIQLDIEEKAKREKAPTKVVKVNENLPEFIESSEEGVYGYWDCGILPIAVVGDSKARPYHEAKKTQKASNKSMNKTNAKIEKEIREIDEWLEVNRRVADKAQVVKKENRRAELVDKITEDRQVRIYAVEARGGNKKIDYFAYIGDDRHAPKTPDDFKTNSNVYKVQKEGFKFLKATNTPVIEVYGKPLEDKNGKITYSDIRRIVDATPGGNTQLNALCDTFAEAEADESKTAFRDHFKGNIPERLAEDVDKQKNDYAKLVESSTKRAEMASSGRKSGGILKSKLLFEKILTFGLGAAIGLGVGVGLTAVGQVPGYAVDANNENYVRTVVEAETENILSNGGQEEQNKNDSGAVAVSKGSKTTSQKTSMFKYEVVNKEGNVKVVPSDDSNIQKMFESDTNPATFGVPAKEIGQNAITGGRNFWSRLAVTNWKGLNYSEASFEGAFSALGEMAGEEVGVHGVNLFKNNQLTKNEVIYPNGTTNPESLERQLRDLGASEEEANAAVSAYANSFIQAYMESENQVVVDEEEDGYDITDGNLQETVSTVLGEDVQVINANYNDSTKKVSIFGVDNDNNLIGVECNNNLGIKITSAEGIETVLLDAAEKDSYETTEYKPFNDLNLSESYKNKAYNYLGDVYGGEIAGIYYDITPTKADGTNDAHYDTTIVSVAESNLDVTVENINVYSDTHLSVTAEDVAKTALSEITEGKLAGATSLYTKTSEATDRTTIENQLDAKTIEQIKKEIEDIILQANEWTAYVPSEKNSGREK